MQLNITTDYAIRIILALANRDGEVVSSKGYLYDDENSSKICIENNTQFSSC